MTITVVCPRCEERFHVAADLLGKKMRCPNPLCRTIFEPRAEKEQPVAAPAAPQATAPSASVVTGSVTDLLPVLPAEFAKPPAQLQPAPAPPRPVVHEPPPVRKPVVPPPRPEPSRPDTPTPRPPTLDFPDDFPGDDSGDGAPAIAEGPQEIGPGTWEAPPVRGIAATDTAAAPVAPATELPLSEPSPPGHSARRRALVVFGVLVLLLVLGGIGLWHAAQSVRAGSEADRYKQVQELYDKEEFAEAYDALQKLMRDFPTSHDRRKYLVLAELISVRRVADDARSVAALKDAVGGVAQFVSVNQQEPALQDYHADLWTTLDRLADWLAKAAEAEHSDEALRLARQAAAEADKFEAPAQVNAANRKRDLETRFNRIAAALTAYHRRETIVEAVRQRTERATATGVRDARALVAAASLQEDAEIADLLRKLVAAHKDAIKYVPATAAAAAPAIDEDALPGLLPIPYLKTAKRPRSPGGIALALARGVLYAFDAEHGEFRWARRVGIDTSLLPLRVPADPITPELVLVLSSDSTSVAALVADTGALVWRHGLEEPCTGQPVLVGRSLLVPTLAGRVDEVEISGGRLLGQYDLGQRLTVGGARQPGTSLVYFPGDEFCVYVLDVARRSCEAVLYTNHPAGSLRGVPILLRGRSAAKENDPAKGGTGWMLLCRAKGTDAVEVEPYKLPIQDADQPPVPPTLHVPGLSWFAPYHDAEKLALATDAGILSLWGIRLKANLDRHVLFRLLKDDYALGGGPGRAQVVHADGDGYWVLSGGRLHRLNSLLRPDTGPDLLAVWPQPPMLGSPLHPAQHHRDSAGRSLLLTATLAADRPVCRLTAVNAASGHFAWQRQLGCIPLHAPVAVDGRILMRDATGLLLLDPTQLTGDKPWQPVDSLLDDADHPDTLAAGEHVMLLPAAGEFIQLTWRDNGPKTLRVRHVALGGAGTTNSYQLPAAPAGKPALGDGFLVLPLANGVAFRLDFKGTLTGGPNWRAPGADEQSPGHVVALGGDRFSLTDGGRGLMLVSWPGTLPRQLAATEVGARIVTPPAVVPGATMTPRICVADAADTLTLLDGERLVKLRSWPLDGKITAGPYVRGSVIVCVLDNRRLVALDPDRGERWKYTMVADIVGEPVLVEGMLVAADVSGRFLALNPETGESLGAGYTLRANTAPETAPVPFGPGRLLVPLNDGTLLLLPLEKLR
jgi:outer membrane protein assembly factor BamB